MGTKTWGGGGGGGDHEILYSYEGGSRDIKSHLKGGSAKFHRV